jgi:D-alanyl-D-alanine carboxypeptidase
MLKMITAKSFIIICEKSKNIVFSRKSIKEREIASLTKIMTCLIVYNFE